MDKQDLKDLRSVDELKSYQREVRAEITAMHTSRGTEAFDEKERDAFVEWKAVDEQLEKLIAELEAREKYVRAIAESPRNVEREEDVFRSSGAVGTARERDIYDLSSIRVDITDPEKSTAQFRDRALKAVEMAVFPYTMNGDKCREHLSWLIRERDDAEGTIARRVLSTGSPAFRRAFTKKVVGRQLSGEEERAFSLSTTAFPVTYTLDPTLLPTDSGSVAPWRTISSVEQITGKEWRGSTSGAITAHYRAEGTEMTDDTPTLAQPVVQAHRADVFIPYSIEAGQDWGGLQTEMAKLINNAKDDLEASAYFLDTGTDEPYGLNTMTSAIDVETAASTTFAVGDLGLLEGALPARFRQRASMVAARATFTAIRAFDTTGAATYWPRLGGIPNNANGNVPPVNGYPSYESSAMSSGTVAGTRIVLLGDFSYFKIVDRIGMSIEIIPNLMGPARGYPTGQRGLMAFWRNGAKPLSESAFRFLKIKA